MSSSKSRASHDTHKQNSSDLETCGIFTSKFGRKKVMIRLDSSILTKTSCNPPQKNTSKYKNYKKKKKLTLNKTNTNKDGTRIQT